MKLSREILIILAFGFSNFCFGNELFNNSRVLQSIASDFGKKACIYGGWNDVWEKESCIPSTDMMGAQIIERFIGFGQLVDDGKILKYRCESENSIPCNTTIYGHVCTIDSLSAAEQIRDCKLRSDELYGENQFNWPSYKKYLENVFKDNKIDPSNYLEHLDNIYKESTKVIVDRCADSAAVYCDQSLISLSEEGKSVWFEKFCSKETCLEDIIDNIKTLEASAKDKRCLDISISSGTGSYCLDILDDLENNYEILSFGKRYSNFNEAGAQTGCRDTSLANKDDIGNFFSLKSSLDNINCSSEKIKSVEKQCGKDLKCALGSSLLTPLLLFEKEDPTKECLNYNNSCLSHVAGEFTKLAGLLFDGIWGLTKMAGRGIKTGAQKFMNLFLEDDDESSMKHLMLAEVSEDDEAFQSLMDDFPTAMRNLWQGFIGALNGWVKNDLLCQRWSGKPHLSKCLEPFAGWDCLSCGDRFNGGCAIIGAVVSEAIPAFLTGGATVAIKGGFGAAGKLTKFFKTPERFHSAGVVYLAKVKNKLDDLIPPIRPNLSTTYSGEHINKMKTLIKRARESRATSGIVKVSKGVGNGFSYTWSGTGKLLSLAAYPINNPLTQVSFNWGERFAQVFGRHLFNTKAPLTSASLSSSSKTISLNKELSEFDGFSNELKEVFITKADELSLSEESVTNFVRQLDKAPETIGETNRAINLLSFIDDYPDSVKVSVVKDFNHLLKEGIAPKNSAVLTRFLKEENSLKNFEANKRSEILTDLRAEYSGSITDNEIFDMASSQAKVLRTQKEKLLRQCKTGESSLKDEATLEKFKKFSTRANIITNMSAYLLTHLDQDIDKVWIEKLGWEFIASYIFGKIPGLIMSKVTGGTLNKAITEYTVAGSVDFIDSRLYGLYFGTSVAEAKKDLHAIIADKSNEEALNSLNSLIQKLSLDEEFTGLLKEVLKDEVETPVRNAAEEVLFQEIMNQDYQKTAGAYQTGNLADDRFQYNLMYNLAAAPKRIFVYNLISKSLCLGRPVSAMGIYFIDKVISSGLYFGGRRHLIGQ